MPPQSQWAYIFHRDLRLIDNDALDALGTTADIIPVFIFTPEQVSKANTYKSNAAIQFMLESLDDLDAALRKKGSRLHVFYGKIETILSSIEPHITGVADGIDYTPYAIKRTERIAAWCGAHSKEFRQEHNVYLNQPGTITTLAGKPYVKFTPYYEAASKNPPPRPRTASRQNFVTVDVPKETTLREMWKMLVPQRNAEQQRGGRQEGQRLLRALPRLLATYDENKNSPRGITSYMSSHNHFGTVSIREVYWAAHGHAGSEEYIRQLYWRDFYGNVNEIYRDTVQTYKGRGSWDEAKYKRWKEGKTGYRVVDDAMRQLEETGYIGNRARLIVGSYLVNELGLNWRLGAEHFARHLVDIDYVQNMYNWLWLDGGLPFGQDSNRRMKIEVQEKKYGVSADK